MKANTSRVNDTSLVTTLTTQSVKHLEEIENDLSQVNSLLHEAINVLGMHFVGLQQAVQERQQLTAGKPTQKESVRLAELDDKIREHTQGAITALQFEDMTRQLNQRSTLRIDGLKTALLDLGACLKQTKKCTCGLNDDAALQKVFQERSEALDKAISKSVHQTHLQSGDVELF